MYERITIGIPTSIGTTIAYITGHFGVVLFIMAMFTIFELITDLAVIYKNYGNFYRNEALKSLARKILYFILIAVAFGVDYTIYDTTRYLYGELEWSAYFGSISIAFLIASEGLSILENLEEFDIKLPFLSSALKTFKQKIESNKK